MYTAVQLANLKPPWTRETAKAARLLRKTYPKKAKVAAADTQEQLAETFHGRKLYRVRAQWGKLDRMIASEEDPGKLDRLIAALARIEEIERRLSARSLPPTIRANQGRLGRRPGVAPQGIDNGVPAPAVTNPETTPEVASG